MLANIASIAAEAQSNLPLPPIETPVLPWTFAQSIDLAGASGCADRPSEGDAASAATDPAAAATSAAGSQCQPPAVTIAVALLQTEDTSPEAAALDAAGKDYRSQLYDAEKSAFSIAADAIQLGDDAGAPAVDTVTGGILDALGLTVDGSGEVAFADTWAGGIFAAIVSTFIGNDIPPDIGDQLIAAGASCGFVAGYNEARDLAISRAHEVVGNCGAQVIEHAPSCAPNVGVQKPDSGGTFGGTLAQTSQAQTGSAMSASSSGTQALLDSIRPGGIGDFIALVTGTGLSASAGNFATTMASTVLRSLLTATFHDCAQLLPPRSQLHISPLPDRPGYRIELV